MPEKKKRNPPPPGRHSGKPAKRSPKRPASAAAGAPSTLRVRQVPGTKSWELVHPPCARQRAEDIEEVESMIAAGELEIANDELRWLLGGCGDFVVAHRLLGEVALAENDIALARGHFGYAFELSTAALAKQQCSGPLPYSRAANQAFFEAAKGLAWCLQELGHTRRAIEVLEQALRLDSADALGFREMLEKVKSQPTDGQDGSTS